MKRRAPRARKPRAAQGRRSRDGSAASGQFEARRCAAPRSSESSGNPMSALGSALSIDSHKRDPKTLALEAAGAIERRSRAPRSARWWPHRARGMSPAWYRRIRCAAWSSLPHHGDRGAETRRCGPSSCAIARCSAPPCPACRGSVLLRGRRRQYRDLIGADDPGVGVLQRQRRRPWPAPAARPGRAAARRVAARLVDARARCRKRAGAAVPGARADSSRSRPK